MKPDLHSDSNLILLNPRMPEQQATRLRSWLKAADHLTGHVFVLTSGSTAASEANYKWVALSKQAVLAAAEGANQHLGSNAKDIWLHSLPDFHVGGLGIWARAELSGAKVVKFGAWTPKGFAESIHLEQVTLASLVPTQVHDLVTEGVQAPSSMRAIIIGGAALAEGLYFQARELGWPLLCSYGLSEVGSQAATAPLSSLGEKRIFPAFNPMPHLTIETAEDNRISISGASVLTGYVMLDQDGRPIFQDPKQDGWLITADFGKIENGLLTVLGRESDRIKIGGEIVNLGLLRKVLDEEATKLGLQHKVALLALPDTRLESVIGLAAEDADQESLEKLTQAYGRRVMPFEAIRQMIQVKEIPRTELGKVKWAALSALVPSQ